MAWHWKPGIYGFSVGPVHEIADGASRSIFDVRYLSSVFPRRLTLDYANDYALTCTSVHVIYMFFIHFTFSSEQKHLYRLYHISL